MKTTFSIFLPLSFLLFSGCSTEVEDDEQVVFTDQINDPCSIFVSQYAPSQTPRLEENEGKLELHISFAPSKGTEADQVLATTKAGETEFLITKTKRKIIGLRISEDVDFVVQVSSKEEANLVLKDLCFDEGKLHFNE